MKYNVLIIGSSTSILDELEKVFTSTSFTIQRFLFNELSVNTLSDSRPDIFILGSNRSVSLEEMMSNLRKESKPNLIPIVTILFPSNGSVAKRPYLPTGADDFLTYPIIPEEVVLRVDNIIQKANINRKNCSDLEQLKVISTATSQAGNSIVIINNKGEISWVNEGFLKLYECDLDDFKMKFGENLFNSNPHSSTYKAFQKCRTMHECVTYDSEWVTDDGRVKYIQTTLTPILDINKNLSKIVAIESDITDLKIAENELEEKHEHLLSITENLEQANTLLDDQRNEIEKQKLSIETEKAKSDALLNNILPFEVARSLEKKGVYKPKKFKEVSVLFTDFIGFSKLSVSYEEIDEFLNVLGSYFETFDEITSSRFIEKIKTIGDSYMCVGGLPRTNHSHPFDTVLAALEMQRYVEKKAKSDKAEGEPVWRLRIGIHTGSVIAGVIGKWKFAYDIWGDTVNIASRMETAGEAGMVNVSETTYQYIKDYFQCTYRGKVPAKNIGEINMYFVERILPEYSEDSDGYIPNAKFRKILASF